MPVASAANQSFIKAKGQGLGDADFSAVFKVVMEAAMAEQQQQATK